MKICLGKINGHTWRCNSAETGARSKSSPGTRGLAVLFPLFHFWSTMLDTLHCHCAAKNQSKTKQKPKETPNPKLESKQKPALLWSWMFLPPLHMPVTSTFPLASKKAFCSRGCYSNSGCLEKAVFTCQLMMPDSSCCDASKERLVPLWWCVTRGVCLQWLMDAALKRECHSWAWGTLHVERKMKLEKGSSFTEMM